MPLDLHCMFQDLMKAKAHVLSGLHISEGMRESRTHIQVDYFCIAEPDQPFHGPERGIRPFADFRRFNVLELEGLGRSLGEGRFRYHVGRTLVMENPAGQPSRQGEIGLTILVVHKPEKLFKQGLFRFEKVTPWKYRSVVMNNLPVTIILLRELQKVDGGEPLAWLQLLEPDPERRVAVWANILGQKIPGREQIRRIMMKADEEAYMTIAEELRAEGHQKGLEEGEVAGVLKAKIEVARNMLRKGCNLGFTSEVTGLSYLQIESLCSQATPG
jgi:hypothetical protein